MRSQTSSMAPRVHFYHVNSSVLSLGWQISPHSQIIHAVQFGFLAKPQGRDYNRLFVI